MVSAPRLISRSTSSITGSSPCIWKFLVSSAPKPRRFASCAMTV